METLLVNFSGPIRIAVVNGKRFLVAPATLIVPGVLRGSKGALYYPPEEVVKDPTVWNAIPITVNHPTDGGLHVSARSPEMLSRYEIGRVFSSTGLGGSLKSELWIDEEAANRVDRRVVDKLKAGEKIELSTGLFTDNEAAPKGASYNGKPYDYVARNYKPDHLAILLDQKGACSIEDGCGVLVNEEGYCCEACKTQNTCSKTHNEGKCPECGKELDAEGKCPCGYVSNALPNQPKSKSSGKYKRMNAGTGKGDTHEAAQRGYINLSDDDKHWGGIALQEFKEAGTNPASWVADEDKWERAKAAADKGGYGEDSYYAIVTHIYKNMGGSIRQPGEEAHNYGVGKGGGKGYGTGYGSGSFAPPTGYGSGKKVLRPWNPVPEPKVDPEMFGATGGGESYAARFWGVNQASNNSSKEESEMNREQIINWLTTNCEEWKGERDTLVKFSDMKLNALAIMASDANSARAVHKLLQVPSEVAVNAMPEFIKKKMEEGEEEEDDEEEEEPTPPPAKNKKKVKNEGGLDGLMRKVVPGYKAVSDAKEKVLTKTADTIRGAVGLSPSRQTREKHPGTSGDHMKWKDPSNNSEAPKTMTMQELLQYASPEDRAVWNHAVEVEKKEREQLVSRLTANVSDPNLKKQLADQFGAMSLPQLRLMTHAVPTANSVFTPPLPPVNGMPVAELPPLYTGAAGSPGQPVSNEADQNDVLDLPRINWAEEKKAQAS